ncbi:putative phage-associated protein [Thalassovita mediterranea]|jgi:uncharacterized phage-associated protein|uniref:Putative phage-associated protein n=2 Tax=Thalassovita mediterranea TaxID=340021 RepID=A0A0P1GRQ0_9RHOB|nr:putative phage-associated protein [Thalassovita mediterranea]SIS30867.1 Uncharacterized phage-associated protein [Thalassovita mediterranea]
MYDARQIANWFVGRFAQEGKKASIMTLLKLVYIAHGWFLETRLRPMFPNQIQAWKHGPVIPDIYREFRSQGIDIKSKIPNFDDCSIADEDVCLLEDIFRIYGSMSPFVLSDLTHIPGGPWDIATKRGGNYAEITNDLILAHYQAKRSAAQKASA